MAVKKIDENPTITDTIQIDFQTTDAEGNPLTPFRLDQVIIYYIERSFTTGSYKTFTDTVGDTSSTVYYTDAIPVKTYGGEDVPAWLSTDTENAFVELIPFDDDGNAQSGVFRATWEPELAQEGDYVVCWKWTPLLASEKISAHTKFMLQGNLQATTTNPALAPPETKYEDLLNLYTPEMFKLNIAYKDMTPSVLARLNASVGKGFLTIENLANQMLYLLDANATHEALLPYLANLFKQKLWSNDPTLWRRQIKRAIPLNKQKGTLGSLVEGLESAGFLLKKLTRYWQVTSPSTWTEGFLVGEGQVSFKLSKLALLPANVNNFTVSLRGVGESSYTPLTLDYVSFANSGGITNMVWLGESVAIPIELIEGDHLLVTYQINSVPNQSIENYIRALPLMDIRDEKDAVYPLKNWNVKLLAEDDALFDTIVTNRHPFAPLVVYGQVRTEFAYSENVYNMDEYNGCASGETQIVTDKGLKKLKDIGDDFKILTEYGFKKFDSLKNQGKKKTLKLKTKMGRELILTPNHKLRIMSENGLIWKQLKDVKVGEYILGKKGGCFNKFSSDESLWYLAGFVYGDGYLDKNFINWIIPEKEEESKNQIENIIKQFGGKFNVFLRTPEKHQKNTIFKCNENINIIRSSRNQLPKLGEILPSYEKKGKWKAHVPDLIWNSGESQICAFLRGLFDTDGSVQKGNPILTTKWNSLATEVQSLLLLLGILSSVTSYPVTYKNEIRNYFRVRVIGKDSVKQFSNKINFSLTRKKKALDECWFSANVEGKEPTIFCSDRTVIPFADNIIKSIFPTKKKISKICQKERTKEEQRTITLISRLKQNQLKVLPDNHVKNILDKALEYGVKNENLSFLKQYVENDWFFDKVVCIEDGDEIEVFDPLSVEETESYISNGLVSHNSLRNSNYPCDIDRTFIDNCSACQSSSISVDVEMEDISDDRLKEATEIVKSFIPFHTQLYSISFNGAINEYFIPPIEDIEILIYSSIDDHVVIGQGDFNRIIPLLGSNSGQILRNELSTAITMASGTATGFNSDVVLFAPTIRFDLLGLTTDNLLEILTGTNAGEYVVTNPGQNTVGITQSSPDSTPFPLDGSAFTFRLSNNVWTDSAASIFQDDLCVFSDNTVDFTYYNLLTQDNSTEPWKIVISSGIYAGTYTIKDLLPDNTLVLLGWNGTANVSGLSYTLKTFTDSVVTSSYTGNVSVTRRGRIETEELASWGVDGSGDYFARYAGQQYKILGFADTDFKEPYIAGYTSGNAGAVNVTFMHRLSNNATGYVDVREMFIITAVDYETALDIQNGSNPPITPVETSSFKENYLVKIGSEYFGIVGWNGNRIDLEGPKKTWGLTGTSVGFSLINYLNTSPVFTKDDVEFFNGIDRRGGDAIVTTTVDSGLPLALRLAGLNSSDGISETVSATEGISFTIKYRDGTTEKGEIQ